jgi:hypothetical protein
MLPYPLMADSLPLSNVDTNSLSLSKRICITYPTNSDQQFLSFGKSTPTKCTGRPAYNVPHGERHRRLQVRLAKGTVRDLLVACDHEQTTLMTFCLCLAGYTGI